MRLRKTFEKTALFCALMALAGPAAADDWSSLGLDGTRTRLSGERSGSAFGLARWEHTLPPIKDLVYRALMSSPAVADGYVVYGTTDNFVRGLREQDGAELWQFRTKDSVFSSPAVWRGWAYVVDTGRQLYALRVADGSLVWKHELEGIAYGSPVVFEGSVFISTGDPVPRVTRLDAETGKVLWRVGADLFTQSVYGSLAVAEGRVIVAESSGRYHSLALTDGSWQWSRVVGGAVNMSSPLVANGRVYLLPGGTDGRLHALDLSTGEPVKGWPVTLPLPEPTDGTLLGRQFSVSSPAAAPGVLVFDRRVEDRLDKDGDGVTDTIVLDEAVMAVDAEDGRLIWNRSNGRILTGDPNRVPTHGVSPTPALWKGRSSEVLVAVASSLSPTVQVLDLGTGNERWKAELSGSVRSSPVLANGRLLVGTDTGVIHSFLSRTNAPPGTPIPLGPGNGADVDASAVTLRWLAALDPNGGSPQYEVRLDDDGELLHDADLAVTTVPGQTSLEVPSHLAPGRVYAFAVRARDAHGAWSGWSAPAQFRAVQAPPVELDGTPVAGLAAALAQAHAGSIVTLGAGTFPLSSTLRLPAGVTLAGAAPHLTVLSGKGLAVAVQAGAGNQLRQLTVTGAKIGVEVTAGDDARLQNVILRDNDDAGLSVSAGAGAHLVSATVARNGAGVRAAGQAELRNLIVTGNGVGVAAADQGRVSGRYDNVFGNRTADYQGTEPTATDLRASVRFGSGDQDLRLLEAQASTDRGDPTDEFANEPEPNGGRINMGAFGNTPFAELSDPSLLPPPPPPEERQPPAKPTHGGSCSLADGARPDGGLVLVLAVLLFRRRRR